MVVEPLSGLNDFSKSSGTSFSQSYRSDYDNSRRISSKYVNTSNTQYASSAQMAETVNLLKQRVADELGAAVSRNILSSYARLIEWISSERLRRLPTEGSAWDKVLAWAQSFAEKFNDFDLAVEQFTGGNYDGAEIAFGYCILLLELGEDNASALQTSFGFFFQRSLDLIALLDRVELLGVSSEVTEQLILGYADLVTLISDIALRFYQIIRSSGNADVTIDIYTDFASTINSFQTRRDRIVEAMWSYQLTNEGVDITHLPSIKTLRSWLSLDDSVLKYKTNDHTSLVNDRYQLTCLWLQPYLTRFLNSSRDSLVITGGTGSGKSVLAGTIVDTLLKTATKRSYSVVYVPIDARIKTYATSLHVAQSLLFQLLEQHVGNVQQYKILAETYTASLRTKDITTYENLLWSTAAKIVEHTLNSAKETIVIVDGVDEISEDPKYGQTLLKNLRDVTSRHEKVRLIALTQPSALASNTKPDVDMDPDLIYDDIFAVVTSLLVRSPHFTSRSQIEQDILVDKVVNASKGSFLWAKLVSKSLVMENSPDQLTKAVETLHRSPKSIPDVTKDLLTSSNLSEEGKLLVLWLTISERPLTVEELTILYGTDPRKPASNEKLIDVLTTLKPIASLVFLQDGLLYLRHTIIRQTLTTWFHQNKSVRDPTLDFVIRLLTHLRNTTREQLEPTFTPFTITQVDQKFNQSSLVEYAIRYWPKHYLDLPVKTREISPDLKKDLVNVIPSSTSLPLIEQTTWTWLPVPTQLTWQKTTTDLRRKVLGDQHIVVLQSVINVARIYQSLDDTSSSAYYYYLATQFSIKIYSPTHPLTIQCANYYLDITKTITITSRTETVNQREEILIVLIESYKKQYGATSEKVISLQRLLIELYKSIKEEKKVTEIETHIRGSATRDGTDGSQHQRRGLGVRVKSGSRKHIDYQVWDFNEEHEHDQLIKIDWWKRIDELLQLAHTHASKGEIVKAEQYYVEAWYYMSLQKVTSIESHLKRISLAVSYAQFLQSVKRESESAALLTGIWEEYESSSVTRNEQIATKFVEVAKVMKSVSLTSVALNVFKYCSAYYKSINKTESSSYKEIQEYEKSTHQELIKQASSSSGFASNLSESAVTEIFTYLESSKSSQLDVTSVSAVRQVVTTYMSQHRYKESTQTIKKTLRVIWSSLFSVSTEDVTLTTNNTEFAIEMVDKLIQCYRLRHRYTQAVEFRERLYHALKLSRKIDDKLVQHNITELFSLYEYVRANEKIVQLHRELLEEYKKVYGPNHQLVIKTLFSLARLTSPEPVSVEYYRQIVNILSKDSEFCHPDAIEPLKIVASHYWNERRYPGAVWAYSLLFRTFVHKSKDIKAFQEHTFVSTIYNRYVTSLRATTTEITTVYDITTQYRKTVISVFGATHQVSIQATLYLARVCASSKRYQSEAIVLYEQLLKESSSSEYHAEIKESLEAIYTEQSLEATRNVSVTASSEQISRAVSIVRTRLDKNRSEFGWAHHESLEQLKEMTHLYARQSRKEEAYKELNEATRQIVSSENSSTSLIQGASTVAASYIAIGETHRAVEIAEEMRWQLVTKDTSNSKKYNIDVTTTSRSAAIYIAQLEYALRQDTTTSFNEIYLSILTEIVYYEEFQRSIRSNLSIEVVFSIAARVHSFLSLHQRSVMKTHVENELISFFIRSSGEKAKVGDVAQVRVLVITMLEYIQTHEVKNFVHSVGIASIQQVRHFLRQNEQKQACDLAQTAFRYVHAVGGYKTPSSVKLGLTLGIAVANIDISKGTQRQGQIQVASEIIRALLHVATDLDMNLAGIPVQQTNVFITVFGEEQDYSSLEWFLTTLWTARETHRNWKPAVVMELGYRLVLARFLLGKHDLALQLATDIAYNLRRVYGATHLATLEVNVLLSQLNTSTGIAFQSQKGAEEIAKRYYKRAITIHENVLRSLTVDPLGLNDRDDASVLSHDPEPIDLTVVVDKDASQGTYARRHLLLLKHALERFGGYPKGYAEYEVLNADLFRAYPDELQGVEGIEKWGVEKFGHGKASSGEGALDTNVKKWSLTEHTVNADGKAVNGHSHRHSHSQAQSQSNGYSHGQTHSQVTVGH